jgi:hypothetical protein
MLPQSILFHHRQRKHRGTFQGENKNSPQLAASFDKLQKPHFLLRALRVLRGLNLLKTKNFKMKTF